MRKIPYPLQRAVSLLPLLIGLMLLYPSLCQADSVSSTVAVDQQQISDLQQQIDEKNQEIKKLEEIAKTYRDTIAATAEQAQTLRGDLAKINSAIAKLQNEIRLNQQKIQKTNLEIQRLKLQIDDTTEEVNAKRSQLAVLIVKLDALENESPLQVLLKNERLSDYFGYIEMVKSIETRIYASMIELRTLTRELAAHQSQSESKAKELKQYAGALGDAQKLQVIEKQDKNRVLTETQSQEKKYQELLADTKRRQKALEDEILSYEAALHFTLDPSLLPTPSEGVLRWPVPAASSTLFQCDRTVMAFVTQCFGNTAFAKAGAYSGKGHNGVDFRASAGTEIYAAESGTVRAVGDTDAACRRVSYGKWVLIDHPNNLSTLYAHLSLIKINPGQTVARGELIAYSGKTGYATGPHLHFSVFARNAVEIGQLKSKICGTIMTLPLSPLNGYLNPLDYL